MTTPFFNTVTMAAAAAYTKLNATQLVVECVIFNPSTNAAVTFRQVGQTTTADLPPDKEHYFPSVDLSTIEVKGTSGNVISLFANSRQT